MTTIPSYVHDAALSIHPVGSRVTCDPAPTGTDDDWLVLLRFGRDVHHKLSDDDWTLDGSFIKDEVNRNDSDTRFRSYKNGDLNLIVTKSPIFFRRFMAASSVAKRLNLLDKADRIALFQAVLYGNSCDNSDVLL